MRLQDRVFLEVLKTCLRNLGSKCDFGVFACFCVGRTRGVLETFSVIFRVFRVVGNNSVHLEIGCVFRGRFWSHLGSLV